MATKKTVLMLDDIDGSEAVETIQFVYRGDRYEIDLSAENVKRYDQALAPFIAKARRIGRWGRGPETRGGQGPRDRQRTATIRAWAIANGKNLGPNGRIPKKIVVEYDRQHSRRSAG